MARFDLLISNGRLIDAANGRDGRFDLGLAGGRVARVEPEINPDLADEVYDATGRLVLPGLVDSHVHVTPKSRAVGLRMLARAGVTCALECGGFVEELIDGLVRAGSGISLAALHRLDPGVNLSGPAADRAEVVRFLDSSLDRGALGLKLLGGHLPLTPETTAAAMEAVNQAGAYAAFHCGTTRHGSNLNGLLEALELAGTNRVHLCHVNAYCRGLTHGSPVQETMLALEALAGRPDLVSESHLGPLNSTPARLEGGRPRSWVTRTCLETAGYEVGPEGLLAAAEDGLMLVQMNTGREVVYLPPEEGRAYLKDKGFKVTVSFPFNSRPAAFLTATEKNASGRFIVTAMSTDGGAFPRNFLLSHGLSLVRFQALTLTEFVHKCCLAPARMLGLPNKGHLAEGADADLVVVDPDTHQALLTVAGGRIVMAGGVVTGTGGTIITTERGLAALKDQGVPAVKADLAGGLFYTAPGP